MLSSSTSDPNRLPPTPPSEEKVDVADMSGTHHQHIWVITGPAGCGKSSVGEHLHQTFSIPYLEGDEFHPAENVKKMAEGHPLTDADRWDWLIQLRTHALAALQSSSTNGVVVTCSALKRKYRDVVRVAAYYHHSVRVHFIYLSASEAELLARVRARKGHYMKDSMVKSQVDALEPPEADEWDVLSVDVSGTKAEVQQLTSDLVNKLLTDDGART